jgi:fucose permease
VLREVLHTYQVSEWEFVLATLLLVVIYIAFISLGLPDGMLGVAWPIMHAQLGVPVSAAGGVAIIVSSGTIISSLVSGRVLKRFGTGKVTFISVAMTAIALLGISIAPSLFWIVLMGIPLGLGAGSVDAGLNDYVSKNYAAKHMNWLHCFWGIGAMAGPLIISQYIVRDLSWRNGYLTVAIVQFALVALLFFALPLWDKVAALVAHGAGEGEMEGQHAPFAGGLLAPLRIPGLKPVLLTFFFYCGIEATIGLWGGSYLVQIKGLELATAALWVSLYFGAITLGRFLSGFVAIRVSSKDLIRYGEILILVGVALFVLPLPAWAGLASFILIGLGCAPIFPAMLHETPARFGREAAQHVMGFQMAVAYIGATLLAPIFGLIASSTTFAIMPLFLLAYIAIMLYCTEMANRKFSAGSQAAAPVVSQA